MSKLKNKIEEALYGYTAGCTVFEEEHFKEGFTRGLKLGREEACVLVEALEIASESFIDDEYSMLKDSLLIALDKYKKSVGES